MAPSASPSSRWSLGSKPSAPKSRIVPCVSRTTKSSSPPTGTSGCTRLPSWRRRRLVSSSASCCSASAALTSAASWPAFFSSSAFSSPEALGISLPSAFCSERNSSKRTPDDLRRSSAERRASTRATSSPRARWEARTRSGSSRSRRRSITPQGYRCGVPAHDSKLQYGLYGSFCPKCRIFSVRSMENRHGPSKGALRTSRVDRISMWKAALRRSVVHRNPDSRKVIHRPRDGLWTSEVIIPKAACRAKDSRFNPSLHPLSSGNGSLQRVDQWKRVDEG